MITIRYSIHPKIIHVSTQEYGAYWSMQWFEDHEVSCSNSNKDKITSDLFLYVLDLVDRVTQNHLQLDLGSGMYLMELVKCSKNTSDFSVSILDLVVRVTQDHQQLGGGMYPVQLVRCTKNTSDFFLDLVDNLVDRVTQNHLQQGGGMYSVELVRCTKNGLDIPVPC